MFDVCGLGWLIVGNQRKKLRESQDIKGDSADDFACSLFCSMCTNCQTADELNSVSGPGPGPGYGTERPLVRQTERVVLLQPKKNVALDMDV